MQISIAICDDQIEICGQIETFLEKILKEKGIKFDIDTYNNGNKLCEEMKKATYDLIFLDIGMSEMCGLETGRFIRDELKDERVQIAYISSKKEHAMKLFEFRPINFLIKPLDEEKVEKVINKYLVIVEQNSHFFEYKIGYDIYRIPISKILYFENNGRKISIVTEDGKIDFYESIENVYKRVKNSRFLYIHKSIIVNYDYVKRISYEEVELLGGKILSISQSRRKDIREKVRIIRKENK